MKRLIAALALVAVTAGCDEKEEVPPPSTQELSGELRGDTTWDEGSTVVLKQHVFVLEGTLTIKPGVTVKGEAGAALVITRTAKIDAQGTAEKPIVFTSSKEVGSRARQDWGGLVLLGNAKLNLAGGSQNIEGFAGTEGYTVYGGTDDNHDCGTLKYARIEFAGAELAPGNEINALTLGGCGAATTIDYVQTHRGSDDGVEVFGGTVNLRHVLVTFTDDDGLDYDLGWTGKAQYVIIQSADTAGNYGIEASSSKTAGLMPRSSPEIWNLTLIGSKKDASQVQAGIQFKEDAGARVHRALIAYWFDSAIDVAGTSSPNATNGTLYVKDSIFFDNANKGLALQWPTEVTDNDSGLDELAVFSAAQTGNRFVDPLISVALELNAPKYQPAAGSPALVDAPGVPTDAWFEKNGFVGAVGSTDWTAGWSAFPVN